jgi:hypothetical protein
MHDPDTNPLMGENKFVIAIWAGVSSNDALSSPARTKRLLRRLKVRVRCEPTLGHGYVP